MYKDQTDSFRNRAGVQYACDQDILNVSLGDLKEQAKSRVSQLRANSQKAFYEKHDGFYRVFVEAA